LHSLRTNYRYYFHQVNLYLGLGNFSIYLKPTPR
jgi:hypothetical protein